MLLFVFHCYGAIMIKLLITTLLLFNMTAIRADSFFTIAEGTPERNAAHYGMSSAIYMFSYALDRKALRLDKLDAMIFSLMTTTCIGLTYKYMQSNAGWGEINHANLWNHVGELGGILTIQVGGW